MGEEIPDWESELWHYVSIGDGKHCPLLHQCSHRKAGKWCHDTHAAYYRQLIDADRFDFGEYEFLESGADSTIFSNIETLANEFLELGNIKYPPVPETLVQQVDAQNPIETHLLPLKTCHGALWQLRNKWIIQLNQNDSNSNQRFTLFHEAFHVLAHRRLDRYKVKYKQGPFLELMADYFAGHIMMPKDWVIEEWYKTKDLDRVTKVFNVPKPLMCIRLKRLGLI